MSLPVHVEIVGENQGEIKGSCDMKGREGTIRVHHVHHELHVPSGEKGGKRIHSPLVISKSIDQASPKLSQALASSEILKSVKIKWYRIDPTGHEEHYYTVELDKARIKSLTVDMETENVAFSYKTITWRWENPAVETMDTWEEPTS